MVDLIIQPSSISGELHIPPSKSHSHRALLFSMMGSGLSQIHHFLDSADSKTMLKAITQFGAHIERQESYLRITGGRAIAPDKKRDKIDVGNSGIAFRFFSAIAATLPSLTIITGDDSIRNRRPIFPLIEALRQLGGTIKQSEGELHIQGPIAPGTCHLTGEDSQPVSALLIATSFLDGPTEILVENPGEKPWIDLTLHWLKKLGGSVENHNYTKYVVKGGLQYSGFDYTVPGDYSTAAFPIAATLITQSHLTLLGLDPDDVQGDKALIPILQKMGARIHWKENKLCIFPTNLLIGQEIDVNPCIDALPILALIGCFAKGTTTLYNGAIARSKESDRIMAICQELKKMGAAIEERPDGLIIKQSSLHGAHLNSHHDHRIALTLAVAALAASGTSHLSGSECLAKTYPSFTQDFQNIGAHIELDSLRV